MDEERQVQEEKQEQQEQKTGLGKVGDIIERLTVPKPDANGDVPSLGWSWGAFCFGWIWGLANRCFFPLLIFLGLIFQPITIVVSVCNGLYGNVWLWNKGRYKTVEELKQKQRVWNYLGKVVVIAAILSSIVFTLCLFNVVKSSLG